MELTQEGRALRHHSWGRLVRTDFHSEAEHLLVPVSPSLQSLGVKEIESHFGVHTVSTFDGGTILVRTLRLTLELGS